MNKMIFFVVTVLALVFGAGGSVWAVSVGVPALDLSWRIELEVRDLVPGTGDGLIVYDHDTGLEWLSLEATKGLSYEAICSPDETSGVYLTEYGFGYATTDELLELYAGVEILTNPFDVTLNGKIDHMPDVSANYYANNVDGVLPLLTLMSSTFEGTGYSIARGMFGDLSAEGNLNVAQISLTWIVDGLGVDLASAAITKDGGKPFSEQSCASANPSVASYLVRDASAVPLPGAVFFLGSGLIALLGTKRRFQKK